jgi:phosphatidylinositol alpha 1,6-mannosyltransferase
MIVAPGPGPDRFGDVRVLRLRSLGLPRYRSFPLGIPDARLERELAAFRPDVAHLASPIVVGAAGMRAAHRLDVPTVAIYQTDVAAFARRYGVRADALLDLWIGRIHRRADRTLVPSSVSREQLAALGVTDMHLWGRGVSLDLFSPGRFDRARYDRLSREGRDLLVGYVGRLAAEKEVRRLRELNELTGTRLVVIGGGPERGWLQRNLPGAYFSGELTGEHLATAFASLDLFVHPGRNETFCQTVQEAQASGVPVIAPAAGGPLDLVEHGRTGLLFDPDQHAGLWRATAALARDEALRGRLRRAALERVSTRSWASVVAELTGHYEAVIAGRSSAAA